MDRLQQRILRTLGTPVDNCYIASEAYYHLKGGKAAGYKPVQGYHEGVSHWWLVDARGKVIDITAAQFVTTPNYSAGRGRGFLTKQPSKRTQQLLNKL